MDDKDYVVGGDTAPGVKRAKLEQQLRRLEVEAYCAVVSAFRAQGELTWKKAQLLQDLRQVLRVPEERHKMELKRVTDDETLAELAKLSAGLHTPGDDDAKKSRAGRKKPAGNAWGGDSGNRDKTLPYLDAVVVTPSSQPPNLSKIPAVAAAKGGAKGGAKGAVAPKPAGATAAASAKPAGAAANRKRKAPSTASTSAASTKGGAPVAKKRATKPTKGAAANVKADADASLMELSSAELGEENEAAAALGGDGDDDEEQDEAHIKEVEEQLRAKQEQLKAELAALQAEMEEDDDEEEEEEELEEADEGPQHQGEGEQGAGDGDVEGDSALREGAEVEAAAAAAAAAQEVAME